MRNVVVWVLLFGWLASIQAAEIWVSPTGSDQHPGTQALPKASLHAALREARELRRLNDASIKDGITIYMHGGRYVLDEPILLRSDDAGTLDSPTTIKAITGERPVLSGGKQVSGWKKLTSNIPGLPFKAKKHVWVAEAPREGGYLLEFRQLWVNGKKAVRARDVNDDHLPRITSWDKKTGTMGVPAKWISKFTRNTFQRPESMEFTIHQRWAIANLRVANMVQQGNEVLFTFQQPEARIQAEHPWPTPMMADSVRSPFFLSNAIEFLDQPGEWFLDVRSQKLYYWPRKGENLNMADVVVPHLETLVEVAGTMDAPISDISFEGITFAYSTWMRPSTHGHVPLQAGMYLLDAYKLKPPGVPGNQNKGLENQAWIGRPPAAVQLRNVTNTRFERCRFEHLGSCGLDYVSGSQSDTIIGCVFQDIAGNGIQAGRFSEPGVETHLAYDPKNPWEICMGLTISNNLITNVTNEDWGCVGIAAGYVRGINIEHNDISNISYTGISLGWGWTKTANCMRENRVHANYIHHYARHMYDVAGIYTLSAQPNTFITENVIDNIYRPSYVHDPNHWFYLYTDEGSSFITLKNNWCPAEKFLANANGPGNVWENNGPQVADTIRQQAGLELAYRNTCHKQMADIKLTASHKHTAR
jgi:hypothetical protein